MKKSKIEIFEPLIFIFFGAFHLHRIWGLIDRQSYVDFWLTLMENKGWFYYFLMGLLAIFCIFGIITFFKNLHNNYWWRWIYIFGGGYVLFDLFAIIMNFQFWNDLIFIMYDTSAWYWNILWGFFVLLGGFALILGFSLLYKRKKQ